ncbi:MAG: prepilin-type N-terminal cleavage/methylation domain-containing protein [Eggerthellaceae bacterium]|nr:prepilin-type N-terminal cleavage/methylation domain-containing protein [Eggerthellaceae bacterium]
MLEMLKTRKEALQKRGVKGFTLMEMLIVIAIIAVLVAIAIPVLGAQLARAQAATDEANIRDGYASYQVAQLQDTSWSNTATYWLKSDGTVVASADVPDGAYVCKGASADADNADTDGADVAGVRVKWVAGAHIKYTYDSTNKTVQITADKTS